MTQPDNHLARLFEATGKRYALIRLDRDPRQRWMEANYVETVRSQPAFYEGALCPDGRLVVALFIQDHNLRNQLVKEGYRDVSGELRGEEVLTPEPARANVEISDSPVEEEDAIVIE